MPQPDLIVLRALGAMITYPSEELRAALPDIVDAVKASPLIDPSLRAGLFGLVDWLAGSDPLQAEERYVELFDRRRATSLYLFEHVHGDDRDRGSAMVELKSLYERAGLRLAANELPDYLPVVLEYLSCRDMTEVRDMLGDCAHILRSVGEALLGRASPYSAVFQALLSIAGESGLDAKGARRRVVEPEDLDRDWLEQPAFAAHPSGTASEKTR